MDIHPSVRKLLLGICKTFPDVGKRMKRRAKEYGGVSFATTAMMEEFSQATTDAIRHRNEAIASTHLDYVSNLLRTADNKTREYIDVCYVEVLMFGLDKESKKWGWSLIPRNLKDLYIKMWGSPKF